MLQMLMSTDPKAVPQTCTSTNANIAYYHKHNLTPHITEHVQTADPPAPRNIAYVCSCALTCVCGCTGPYRADAAPPSEKFCFLNLGKPSTTHRGFYVDRHPDELCLQAGKYTCVVICVSLCYCDVKRVLLGVCGGTGLPDHAAVAQGCS